MNKERIAEEFAKGFDCSQVVLEHYAERFSLTKEQADRIGAGFGGGCGRGEMCGTVAAAMIVLGMKYGHWQENPLAQKDIMLAKREEFLNEFLKKYETYSCKELLKYDISKPEELQKVLDEGLMFSFCPQVAMDVIEILDKMI